MLIFAIKTDLMLAFILQLYFLTFKLPILYLLLNFTKSWSPFSENWKKISQTRESKTEQLLKSFYSMIPSLTEWQNGYSQFLL